MTSQENTRRARGWILQFLGQEPVNGEGKRSLLTAERLQSLLFDAAYDLPLDEVKAQIAYLREKGLVETERFTGVAARVLGGTAQGVRINAAGVDVLEKTAVERGVDLGIFG